MNHTNCKLCGKVLPHDYDQPRNARGFCDETCEQAYKVDDAMVNYINPAIASLKAKGEKMKEQKLKDDGGASSESSDTYIVRETVKRLGKELEESGKDAFTIGDLRRIRNEMFEGKR